MAWYSILSAPFHLILIQGVGLALNDAQYDWRTVWAGVGVSLIALSVTAALIARNPPASAKPSLDISTGGGGATFWQALATPAFWLFGLTISIWGMIYAGVALFNVDIFRERGFDQALYFNVLSLVTIVALASKLFFGWLANYVRLTHLLAVCLLATAAPWAVCPMRPRRGTLYVYGVGLGIASGAVALLFFATWGVLRAARSWPHSGRPQMLTVLHRRVRFSPPAARDDFVHVYFSYVSGGGHSDGTLPGSRRYPSSHPTRSNRHEHRIGHDSCFVRFHMSPT